MAASTNSSFLLYSIATHGNFSRQNLSREQANIAQFLVAHNNIDRYVTPFMYLVGFPGNMLSFAVWIQKSMRQSSGCYLAALGLVDICFMTLHVVYELHNVWNVNLLDYPAICESFPAVFLWLQYLSPLLVLGFTVERYISVCHPFRSETLCTTRRAVKVIISLTFAAFSLCIIQAYFYSFDVGNGSCGVRKSVEENGTASLWSIWTWITEMLVFLVVPLAVLGFNVRVIAEARRLHRETQSRLYSNPRKSSATTFTLLTVSFVLIFTTLPVTITTCVYYSFQEGNRYLSESEILEDATWSRYFAYMTARAVIHEIGLTHYACNFIVYYVTSTLFRREVRKILVNRVKKSHLLRPCTNRCRSGESHKRGYRPNYRSTHIANGSTVVTSL